MKNGQKSLLPVAVAATAALLLAGCQEGNSKGHLSQKNNEIQTAASIDTSTLDEGHYEQNPKFETFHPDSLIGSW